MASVGIVRGSIVRWWQILTPNGGCVAVARDLERIQVQDPTSAVSLTMKNLPEKNACNCFFCQGIIFDLHQKFS
jgi:hypothetical protein